ncbi:hypothetical protein [Microcoleus sp. S13_C3]|uniref:hypothetical protein n=1 Tax=Microcoleus sp. S13_C3 TaxID=3055409 RepID=UPI002FD074AF
MTSSPAVPQDSKNHCLGFRQAYDGALNPLFLVRWISAISGRHTNGAIEPPDALKLKAYCFPGIEPPKPVPS